MKSRNQNFEQYLLVEAEIIELSDAITGITKQTESIVIGIDQEVKLLQQEGDRKLGELEVKKNEIIDAINEKISLLIETKKQVMTEYEQKINPISEKLEKDVYPRKNELYLQLMGIPNVKLPEPNNIKN